MRRTALAALLLLGACGDGGEPASSGVVDGTAGPCAAGEREPLGGFTEVAFAVDGGLPRCALLADDDEERSQGLMGQDDLRGYDGMLFRFEDDATAAFHMRDTPLPLSVAFFDEGGDFVSSADMTPCPAEVPDCPSYRAQGPYRLALEVRQGDLADLGVGPGSQVTVTPPA